MNKTKRLIGFAALALVLGASVGCKKNRGSEGPDGGGGGGGGAALDPTKASAEAKAEFAKVVKRYAAATSEGAKLSKSQCDSFSKDFKKVYKRYGKQMTVAWFNSGAVLEECGMTEAAEDIYQKITREVPKYDLAYNNLGVIYWNRKQEQRALDYFKKAVAANPKTRAPRNNLAAALRDKYAGSGSPQQGDFEKAERNLQSVLAVDSNNRLAYENLARLYYDRGRKKDKSYLLLADLVAEQAIRVLKKDDIESADIFNIKGLLFMQQGPQGNQVEALRAFKKAAELEPNHADANMNIAMIAIRFRDYGAAEKSLTIALKDRRQKKNIETYIGLGVAQRGLRKYGPAEKAFKKAMSVRKSDPRPLYNLGILYQEHIAPSKDSFDKSKTDYTTAKDYFSKFTSKASADPRWKVAVADANNRVKNINQLFKDIAEMKKLEAEAKRLEAIQKKQDAEERKRLLDLEKKARAAAASASAPKKEPPKPDPKAKKPPSKKK